MINILKLGGIIVLGVAFWLFYDIGGRFPHADFDMFDRHIMLGIGAWLSALWIGRLLDWKSR